MLLGRLANRVVKSVFAVVFVTGSIIFATSYLFVECEVEYLAYASFMVLCIAILTAVLHRFRLMVWLLLTILGYAIGLFFSVKLLFTPDVVNGYRVAVMTVVVFSAHGFIIGLFGELISRGSKLSKKLIENIRDKLRFKIDSDE